MEDEDVGVGVGERHATAVEPDALGAEGDACERPGPRRLEHRGVVERERGGSGVDAGDTRIGSEGGERDVIDLGEVAAGDEGRGVDRHATRAEVGEIRVRRRAREGHVDAAGGDETATPASRKRELCADAGRGVGHARGEAEEKGDGNETTGRQPHRALYCSGLRLRQGADRPLALLRPFI